MVPITTASALFSSESFSTSSDTSSLTRCASSTVFTPASMPLSVMVGAALGAGESVAVAVGDALGLTEGLGLGCTIVSALLEQAVNRPTPTREITRRIQILFKAVRLLAAIVCRSETTYLRQSLPDLRIKMERTALLETVRQGSGNYLQPNFMREGFAPSAGFMI